eukprot:355827-Chlamydomonas_euryale.AAC.3
MDCGRGRENGGSRTHIAGAVLHAAHRTVCKSTREALKCCLVNCGISIVTNTELSAVLAAVLQGEMRGGRGGMRMLVG